MRGSCKLLTAALAVVVVVSIAVPAEAGQLVSRSRSARGLNAVSQAQGIFLQPVGTMAQSANDLAPVQLFEIVRPANQAIRIGRLFTSCVCVSLEADADYFPAGKPAILRLRNVKATPQAGQMYAMYVQITSPVRTTLQLNTFVRSSMFIPADMEKGEAPTYGNVVADGVLPAAAGAAGATAAVTGRSTVMGDDGIEIIVPRADSLVSKAEGEPAAAVSDVSSGTASEETVAAVRKTEAASDDGAPAKAKIIIVEEDAVADGVLAAADPNRPKTISDALDRPRTSDAGTAAAPARPAVDPEFQAVNAKGIEAMAQVIGDAPARSSAASAAAGAVVTVAAPAASASLADVTPDIRAAAAAIGQSMLDAPAAKAPAAVAAAAAPSTTTTAKAVSAAPAAVGTTLEPAQADDLWATPRPNAPIVPAVTEGDSVDNALDEAGRASRRALREAEIAADHALDRAVDAGVATRENARDALGNARVTTGRALNQAGRVTDDALDTAADVVDRALDAARDAVE
ncbi:MAG: hypothetical protein LUG50_12710 [Planctomycetaceae bacterium]|nr:hypothetical protein [Planctomycetaceae bacterium]